MKSTNLFKASALMLAVAGAFATGSAQAVPLKITTDINALQFTYGGTSSGSVSAGYLTVDQGNNGSNDFLAFCLELFQPIPAAAQDYAALALNAAGLTATQQSDLTSLYTHAYSTSLNLTQQASFQLAVWEILDNKSLTSGAVSGWTGNAAALTGAATLLTNLVNNTWPNAGTPASLTIWRNPTPQSPTSNFQDLIQVNSVPAPGTLALLMAAVPAIRLARRQASV